MSEVRPADLAGSWYPGTAEACARFFAEQPAAQAQAGSWYGAIVPHAGWVYSGAVAAAALSALKQARPDADLAIVFGGHLGHRDRPRAFLEGAWGTPFGDLPIAGDLARELTM